MSNWPSSASLIRTYSPFFWSTKSVEASGYSSRQFFKVPNITNISNRHSHYHLPVTTKINIESFPRQ
ncbi:hypothetical protein Pint_28997 [Pistacia integerrima]|uniref:Uncharacterized protein n=1 Tax=Pistacia integerrima TaxID=434235 RepID=A0ACC0X1V7_9ROSI|nr:hypothetical protein Pint_28997 [Pistacia integerrima]